MKIKIFFLETKLSQINSTAAEISPEILNSSKATKGEDKHISFNIASMQKKWKDLLWEC